MPRRFWKPATEAVTVTTARWYPEPGDYSVVAEVTDAAITSSPGDHRFTVLPTTRVPPTFVDVTAAAGVATTVPVPECGQFATGAAWADVDGNGWQDLVVTRIGDPVQLFVGAAGATFADETAALVAAWAAPGAEEGTTGSMGFPARTVANMALGDLTVHAWDLARATGQEFTPDPAVVDEIGPALAEMAPMARQGGVFGEPVEVGDDASAFDRVLALTGRDPHWQPKRPE